MRAAGAKARRLIPRDHLECNRVNQAPIDPTQALLQSLSAMTAQLGLSVAWRLPDQHPAHVGPMGADARSCLISSALTCAQPMTRQPARGNA